MKKPIIIATILALTGCLFEGDNDDNANEFNSANAKLVLAAATPDYQTSDVILVGYRDSSPNTIIEQQLATTNPSDIAVAVFGDDIYRIGRYNFNNITKIAWDATAETLNVDWQYSVAGDDSNANPHAMLVVSNSSAYVARYNSSDLWQVNPSADSSSAFKLNELDLSAYANDDNGIPGMTDLALLGDHLFVLLQGLDYTSFIAPANSSVLVIDVTDNSIVDTDPDTDGIQAIKLPIRNASDLNLVGDTLYISGKGDSNNSSDTTNKYTGGVVALNTSSFTTELVVDDGDSNSAPYGTITNTSATANGDIYFVGSASWGDDHLYVLTSGTNEVHEITLGDSASYNISDIVVQNDQLFVAVFAQSDGSESAGLKVVGTSTNTLTDVITTSFNPTQIVLSD